MNVPVIDLMLGIPGEDNRHFYEFMRPLLLDEESRERFEMPAQYMFKQLPRAGKQADYIAYSEDLQQNYGDYMPPSVENELEDLQRLLRGPERRKLGMSGKRARSLQVRV